MTTAIAFLLIGAATPFEAGGHAAPARFWQQMAAVAPLLQQDRGEPSEKAGAATGDRGTQPGFLQPAAARLSLSFSRLASSQVAALVMHDADAKRIGQILEALSVFAGQVCNRGELPRRVGPGQIAGAIVRKNVAVYSRPDVQIAIERARRRGRGLWARLARAAVPVSVGGSGVASGLAAAGRIEMSNGWSAGITGGAVLVGLLAGAGRDREKAEQASVSDGGRLWLGDLVEQDLAPGSCITGLYFGSRYPAPLTISIEE